MWPSMQEIDALLGERVRSRRVPARLCRLRRPEPAVEPDSRRRRGSSTNGIRRRSTSASRRTSIRRWRPPPSAEFSGARALAIFGDSITTDHISPAGAIKPTSPAGGYLRDRGVPAAGLQQLRRAPRQPRGHGPRDVRQRPHPEPDGARRRGRRHAPPARRRAHGHLRRGRALPRGGRAA